MWTIPQWFTKSDRLLTIKIMYISLHVPIAPAKMAMTWRQRSSPGKGWFCQGKCGDSMGNHSISSISLGFLVRWMKHENAWEMYGGVLLTLHLQINVLWKPFKFALPWFSSDGRPKKIKGGRNPKDISTIPRAGKVIVESVCWLSVCISRKISSGGSLPHSPST